jgi:hypothetical protein
MKRILCCLWPASIQLPEELKLQVLGHHHHVAIHMDFTICTPAGGGISPPSLGAAIVQGTVEDLYNNPGIIFELQTGNTLLDLPRVQGAGPVARDVK